MNADQQRLSPNHLERAAYAILDSVDAAYVPQHVVGGKFCVDAFYPQGLVVQFDGDYWHGNPAKFPTPDARQKKRMAFDRSQNAYCAKCGFAVLRVWEHEIRNDPEGVKAKLCNSLARLERAPTAPA